VTYSLQRLHRIERALATATKRRNRAMGYYALCTRPRSLNRWEARMLRQHRVRRRLLELLAGSWKADA
jgi:hypothetical protein